ncbi:unnamed protein product [Rotaria sp. Silwood1]|nr:unnamed protein product [Rotaria sp. Silwood1]CAF1455717.1 unnamed protein product [Rotaria sp. Silwood1]CAF3584091.1 unnamed protein product [Rotaria sp. Silwood1]
MNAKVSLSHTSIIEQVFRQTMIIIQLRIAEAQYEPSRLVQKFFIENENISLILIFKRKFFENGQWILIALCMTQTDTVGGAFITMKIRLIEILLGAMWSHIAYLLVHDNIFATFFILIPWIFLFGYLRLFPKLNYTSAVARFTFIIFIHECLLPLIVIKRQPSLQP